MSNGVGTRLGPGVWLRHKDELLIITDADNDVLVTRRATWWDRVKRWWANRGYLMPVVNVEVSLQKTGKEK